MKFLIANILIFLSITTGCVSYTKINSLEEKESMNNKEFTVEIWGDVVCPFTYQGKTKFEKALNKFEHKDQVHIVWKSYQLSPEVKTDTSLHLYNTFNAHRFLHFAKSKNVQNQAKEAVLNAYFTERKNIDNYAVLSQIGEELGINSEESLKILNSDAYSEDVETDIQEAWDLHQFDGVPFFLFNREYIISGASNPKIFLKTLEKAYESWKEKSAQ